MHWPLINGVFKVNKKYSQVSKTDKPKVDDDSKSNADNINKNDSAQVKKFKTNHNGLFFIDGVEFKQDEVKELSSKQLESQRVKHAIKIGALIEV
jgi:hypothetical protein